MSAIAFRFFNAVWLILSPLMLLILPQILYVKRTALRLPEAQPVIPPYKSPAINLLHIGESTVAGVGVKSLDQGFTANLAASLEKTQDQSVNWQTLGVNGIRLNALLERVASANLRTADIIVVTMGVNDTTGFTSIKRWQQELKQTVDLLASHNAPIVFTQVPPMLKFPALPAPLKWFVGTRALLLNSALKAFCQQDLNRGKVFYVEATTDFESNRMAEDGYHPSALGYRDWAQVVAPKLEKILDQYKAESVSVA